MLLVEYLHLYHILEAESRVGTDGGLPRKYLSLTPTYLWKYIHGVDVFGHGYDWYVVDRCKYIDEIALKVMFLDINENKCIKLLCEMRQQNFFNVTKKIFR